MKKVGEVTQKERVNLELNADFDHALEDLNFKHLVQTLKRPKKEMMKYTSLLQETVSEMEHCKHCQGLFQCKNALNGHVKQAKVVENRLYFTYAPCHYYQMVREKETESKQLKKVMMADIDTNDKKQLKVIKWLDDFYEHFDLRNNQKGLYLHGNFGSGKTYLISALLHELEIKKNARVEIVYFQDLLRDLKDDWDLFADKMAWYSHVDLLLLDDIGAEKVSDWGRDEVLGPLLQSRMNQGKTTFFTSNLTIEELESHLSIASGSVDKVKARRIIERIKFLASDMELVSESRRKS